MCAVYYVSTDGSDGNDGLSPATPFCSLAAAEQAAKYGDQVLFRRGDTWRGQRICCQSGITYAAYGDGENPCFLGSAMNYAREDQWVTTGMDNIWRCALDFDADICHIVFDNGAAWSTRKRTLADVTDDLDYYYDGKEKAVFLYSPVHPAMRFSSVEMGKGSLFVIHYDCHDTVIRDLTFRFCNYAIMTYCDRVGDVRNLRIEGCRFSWIGGHEGHYAPGGVRDGNAITIWGSARQVVVDHCEFSQLFDTAFTPQCGAPPNSEVVFEDITLSNCRIEKCHWSTEFWIHVIDDDGNQLGTMRNIRIVNNYFGAAGEGWSANQRWNGAPLGSASHIQTFSGGECAHISDFIVQGNTFEDAAYDLVSFYWENAAPVFEGNTFIQTKDRPLGHFGGIKYMFDDRAEDVIREIDKTATVRFTNEALL